MGDITLYATVLAADMIALAVIVGALFHEKTQMFPAYHKAGFIVMTFGLLAQAALCVRFFIEGRAISTNLPWWALKDLGFALVAGGYLWEGYAKSKLQAVAPEVQAPPAKKAPVKRPAAKKAPAKKTAKAK